MDLQDIIDKLFASEEISGQSVWNIPPSAAVSEVRDQYGELFWDYILERYFIALESNDSEMYVVITIIDVCVTDDILKTFASGCDLRKRFFVRQIHGCPDDIVDVYRNIKQCNRYADDIICWLSKTKHYESLAALKKIMEFDHVFVLEVLLTRLFMPALINTMNVRLDYIFLIAKILSIDPSNMSSIYRSMYNVFHDTCINKTIGALWGNKIDERWLCKNDPRVYKRVVKFVLKHGYLEI